MFTKQCMVIGSLGYLGEGCNTFSSPRSRKYAAYGVSLHKHGECFHSATVPLTPARSQRGVPIFMISETFSYNSTLRMKTNSPFPMCASEYFSKQRTTGGRMVSRHHMSLDNTSSPLQVTFIIHVRTDGSVSSRRGKQRCAHMRKQYVTGSLRLGYTREQLIEVYCLHSICFESRWSTNKHPL